MRKKTCMSGQFGDRRLNRFTALETLEARRLLSGSQPAPLPAIPAPELKLELSLSAAVADLPSSDGQAAALQAQASVADSPELPRVFLDTTYTPSATGQTISVPAGGSVQAAINAAVPGDTILLAAGATYFGNFKLPNKSGSGWITIRSSAPDSSLPAPGTRITPAHASLMPKLVSPNSSPALATENGAHHYRFIGVEFTVAAGIPENYGIVNLGSSTQSTAQTPNNLIFDRVYIHGTPNAQIQNGMRLNSASTAVIDSWFDNCQSTIWESHNIGGYNGPGPYKLVNNTFSGSTIPVIFGGAKPSVGGLIPSDLEIRGNHFTRPLSWRPNTPGYAGTEWYVKNLFELKNAQRVLFEGNLLEHNWPHNKDSAPDGSAQHGFAILLTVRASGDNGAVVQDVTLANNIIRKSNVGISISGTEAQGTRRIKLENNLFDEIGLNWGNNDRSGMFAQIQTVGDVIINHNTIINDGDIIFANGNQAGDLVFTNNIVNHNAARLTNRNFGINAPAKAVGNTSLTAKFFQYAVTKNVMANASVYTSSYPSGNFFPSSFNAVGFTNLAARNYRLGPSSVYRNAGTDGKDLGADIDAVAVATAGAISGVWPSALVDITVNDGEAQWTRVHKLVVRFNQPISLNPGAFQLQRQGGAGSAGSNGGATNLVITPSDDLKTYTVTFTGEGTSGGSLNAGLYEFIVDFDALRDAFNLVPRGADEVLAFQSLFIRGDADGDGDVDGNDIAVWASRFTGSGATGATFADGDFDGDGDVDGDDASIWATNFTGSLSMPFPGS